MKHMALPCYVCGETVGSAVTVPAHEGFLDGSWTWGLIPDVIEKSRYYDTPHGRRWLCFDCHETQAVSLAWRAWCSTLTLQQHLQPPAYAQGQSALQYPVDGLPTQKYPQSSGHYMAEGCYRRVAGRC